MAENEKSWWVDKTIQIPKGLLIEGVTGEEVAVYCEMKSFGPEAKSSLGALSKRLGWSPKKTRTHQAGLWEKGWIQLLKEGKNNQPRHWFLCTSPFEIPPVELKVTLGITGIFPLSCPGITQGTQNGHPAQNSQGGEIGAPPKPTPEANKGLQANNEIQDTSDKVQPAPKGALSKHPDQDLFWKQAKEIWQKKFGQELTWPSMKGFPSKLTEALNKYGCAELLRRFENMVLDPWAKKSLFFFVNDPDQHITRREANTGGKGARGFHQPELKDWEPAERGILGRKTE